MHEPHSTDHSNASASDNEARAFTLNTQVIMIQISEGSVIRAQAEHWLGRSALKSFYQPDTNKSCIALTEWFLIPVLRIQSPAAFHPNHVIKLISTWPRCSITYTENQQAFQIIEGTFTKATSSNGANLQLCLFTWKATLTLIK